MSTFHPEAVIAQFAATKPMSEQKKFKSDWKKNVDNIVESWKQNRPHQSQNLAQHRWAANVVTYVTEVFKLTRVHGLAKSVEKTTPAPLSMVLPLYGPRFEPPAYLDYAKRSGTTEIRPDIMYLKPLTVIHPLYFPQLGKCPQCNSTDIKWHSWIATGYRNVHGVHRDELAIGYQLRCTICQHSRQTTGNKAIQTCFATTSVEFWEKYEEWDIPKGVPHFTKRCALTRDLYKLIIELRPSSTASGLEENIKQLHLNEYHDRKLEYYRTIKQRLNNLLLPGMLLPFSDPDDVNGYDDHPITHDMISDAYANFSLRTRQSEHDRYLKTLTGIVLSLDATFKVTKKATIMTKDKKEKHDTPMKGGVTSVINEMSEILTWRFCQTQSAAEITEMLQGYVERCGLLTAVLAIMVIVDNCCHVRNAIMAALPLTRVGLDVFHFKQRYAAVILNGTKNPHYKEVLSDIVEAILRQRAENGKPAKYWDQQEQRERLISAYEKWLKFGSVWSAAAPKVHAEQLRHVENGCLVRIRQDIASDGSRIEGSHKGWNSIMRSYASGLENMLYLCRDFVLRRNIRIATRTEDHRVLRPFAASGFGSHHVGQIDYINQFWNELVQGGKGIPNGANYTLKPTLPQVQSTETFGIVSSESAATFGGLFDIKEEEDDALDNMHLHDDLATEDEILRQMNIDPSLRQKPLSAPPPSPSRSLTAASTTSTRGRSSIVKPEPDAMGNERTKIKTVIDLCVEDDTSIDANAARIGINSQILANRPVHLPEEEEEEEEEESAEGPPAACPVPSDPRHAEILRPTVKRKVEDIEQVEDAGAVERKKIRIIGTGSQLQVSTDSKTTLKGLDKFVIQHRRDQREIAASDAISSSSAAAVQLQPPAHAQVQGLTATLTPHRTQELDTLMRKLPPVPNSPLTRSQALFSKLAALDVRCLQISRGREFFIFMDLRAKSQWASFKMNAFKWVNATIEYNKALSEDNRRSGRSNPILKNPRALVNALCDVEQKILSRIARKDYKSRSSGTKDSQFWLKHCAAVSLGKDMKDALEAGTKTRQPPKCSRCKTLMYPNGRSGTSGNHKRGVCSDGGPVNMKNDTTPPWPQPPGILNAEYNEFHVFPFLRAVQELYQRTIVDSIPRNDIGMEMEAFASMLTTRTQYNKPEEGMIIFKLYEGYVLKSPVPVDQYVVELAGVRYLRLDCLADN